MFTKRIFCSLVLLCLFGVESTDTTCCVNLTVAVLVERSAVLDFPFAINRTQGLINIAIDKARDIVKHVANLEFIVVPCDVPTCTALKWGALFSEVYHQHRPHAVIGPGCTPSVQTVSRMAVAWNIPHITYVGTDESLGNKKEFSMLSRLSFTMNVFAKFYVEVFNAFHWTYIANIYDESSYLPNLVGTSLQRSFLEDAPHITSYDFPFRSDSDNIRQHLLATLKAASTRARVFLVNCHGDVLRQMSLLAKEAGLQEGEYVFIFYFQLHGDPPVGEYTWRRGDQLDSQARKDYESVMVIRPRRPTTDEFFTFEQEVKSRAQTEYNYTWRDGHEVSIYNIGHYDSFVLYAHALNETLARKEDPRNGRKLVDKMWNRTFPGIGGTVYVNENGDRDTDFTLLDMSPDTGEFHVVAEYFGWTHTFSLISGKSIHWPGTGMPPMNVPVCGFMGQLCISYHRNCNNCWIKLQMTDVYTRFELPLFAVVAICLSSVIIIVILIGMLAYRRLKAEAAIHSLWWRVKWDDVNMQTTSSFFSSRSKTLDDGSISLATHAACYTTIGVFRGTQVHVRKPKIKSLTVDRNVLLELKQMRDITCQNLTRLIGVCPDVNNVCILTEHCSRGNLQDILQNDSIQLDWDFRISLINDIVEGMYYLHTCPIGVHGRLTSSKCVIDSRFVLKVTGFGLRFINDMTTKKTQFEQIYDHTPDLVYLAPEHIRTYPPRCYSQPGDIYSFAIILYEMCTRNEPYVNEQWYISLDDTLDKIKKRSHSPLRPTLRDDSAFKEIVKLAKCCWHESPVDRPTFSNVRRVVKGIRLKSGDGLGKNVLDVLLHRMEQYANNLEGLVEERTKAFLEEKKKSEELLYQVLPKSVADQLRVGDNVFPESYDSVTLYFSDIVGFTNISANSSPFQIIDLLNDLYTCFDTIIENYNVYKVETIGDAYMVVSGLPERNGDEHVRQIACMALAILNKVEKFTIRHQPDTKLQARIGLHSGPVCAGVVGRKMPRYCLFGDTVNTASRMESNGEAMRIHISQQTEALLRSFGNFVTEERGQINIKGKGVLTTYWLIEEVSRPVGYLNKYMDIDAAL